MFRSEGGSHAQPERRIRARGGAGNRSSFRWNSIPCLVVSILTILAPGLVPGAVYEVGPSQTYSSIGEVPWESLAAGDTVRIHWRPKAYHEKWVICRQGTAGAPITVTGVAGPTGNLPMIDGQNATTRPQLDFWNEDRAVVKIGGANTPPDTTPRYIVVENLAIRKGRPPYKFTGRSGLTPYSENCAAIYVEKGEHVTIRNCTLTDCGNGLFTASDSSDVCVEYCLISENGIEGSISRHNVYTESAGILFQFNRLAPLRAGCGGNNLKDRSAGTTIRYNYVEGGNRQLDLVESASAAIRALPSYGQTYVYGNLLVEYAGTDNSQICHYGGDSGATSWYRKGTLFFYSNTVVSYRTGNTTLLRLSTNAETCDCRDNIVHATAGDGALAMLDDRGVLNLENNWLTHGWITSHLASFSGTLNNLGRNIEGGDPGFVNLPAGDFHLVESSLCVGRTCLEGPLVGPGYQVMFEYLTPRQSSPRVFQPLRELGAFEYAPAKGFGDTAADPAVWLRY